MDMIAISLDGKKAFSNNSNDYRCYCDCSFTGLSQGYSMTPDKNGVMQCSRCNRVYHKKEEYNGYSRQD